MVQQKCAIQTHELRKTGHIILAFCWVLGLLCGIWIFLRSEVRFNAAMHGILAGKVSFAGLLCVLVFPALLSIYAVSASNSLLFLPICFCKAFLYSYVSIGIFTSFGSAGWLFRCLLLFDDCVTVPVLYLFWLRNLDQSSPPCALEPILLIAFTCLTGIIDYCIILPFLACLIDF